MTPRLIMSERRPTPGSRADRNREQRGFRRSPPIALGCRVTEYSCIFYNKENFMPVERVSKEAFRKSHEQAHFSLTGVIVGRPTPGVELDSTQESLLQDHHEFLREIADGFLNLKDPKEVLARGFEALGKVEARQFVVQNILESVKRGESLNLTLRKFNELGLTDLRLPSPDFESTGAERREKSGGLLMKLMGWTRKFTHALFEIIINAIKAIPKFAAIKPSVGVVGAFPSLTFELEGEAVTIHDFYFYLLGKKPE